MLNMLHVAIFTEHVFMTEAEVRGHLARTWLILSLIGNFFQIRNLKHSIQFKVFLSAAKLHVSLRILNFTRLLIALLTRLYSIDTCSTQWQSRPSSLTRTLAATSRTLQVKCSDSSWSILKSSSESLYALRLGHWRDLKKMAFRCMKNNHRNHTPVRVLARVLFLVLDLD